MMTNTQTRRQREIRKAPEYGALGTSGAGNETRTRDPNLGKVVLYQLSYSRGRTVNFIGVRNPVK